MSVEFRKCDQKGCDSPATHTCVWTKQQYYCPIHAAKVLQIADAMGFPTPSSTMRMLSLQETVVETEEGDA